MMMMRIIIKQISRCQYGGSKRTLGDGRQMMMMMIIIIQANLQMPIWWQQTNTGCWETNDDDDDNNNSSKSPDADMVAANEHWVLGDE